jgi:hypothetical protein
MGLFLAVLAFWVLALLGAKSIFRRWQQRHLRKPARFLNELRSVDYYRQLSAAQFETLVMLGIKKHNYTLLGDPWLERAKEQGYIWKKGKKSILAYRSDNPLTLRELEEIEKKRRAARAEQALVFSPFPKAPQAHRDGVEVLYGKRLLHWFAMLDDVAPPIARKAPAEKCQCGSPMKERVSRAGRPLLICSMFPDCRIIRTPRVSSQAPPPSNPASRIRTA